MSVLHVPAVVHELLALKDAPPPVLGDHVVATDDRFRVTITRASEFLYAVDVLDGSRELVRPRERNVRGHNRAIFLAINRVKTVAFEEARTR